MTKWFLLKSLLLLVVACSQNYSEKKVEDALRDKGFVPVPRGSSHVEREKTEFDGKLWGELVPEIPDGWIARTPLSSMRLAEYILPSDTGAEKPILAVFSGIGGTVDENINRWYGQFEQPDGSPTKLGHRPSNLFGKKPVDLRRDRLQTGNCLLHLKR